MEFTLAAPAAAIAGLPICPRAMFSTGSTGFLKRSSQPVVLVGGSGFSKPRSVDWASGPLSDDIGDMVRISFSLSRSALDGREDGLLSRPWSSMEGRGHPWSWSSMQAVVHVGRGHPWTTWSSTEDVVIHRGMWSSMEGRGHPWRPWSSIDAELGGTGRSNGDSESSSVPVGGGGLLNDTSSLEAGLGSFRPELAKFKKLESSLDSSKLRSWTHITFTSHL